MSIQVQSGSLAQFFDSAQQTAREIDQGIKLTPKNTIWVESSDLLALLKPERAKLIKYLRKHDKVVFKQLVSAMDRTPVSLNHDLALLSKYDLVHVVKEANPGHGVQKVIRPTYGDQPIEFSTKV